MIEELKKELTELSDKKYAQFSSSLTPNAENILGVRLPILRKIAAKIAKQNPDEFLKENDDEFMELTMIEGMIIAKGDMDNQKERIRKFIPKINNWAVCDCFCASLKCFKNNPDKKFLEKYLNSNKEFELRFAYVILLGYFIESDYDWVISEIAKFNNESYYAKMAAAWCLSICLVKNYQKCLEDIKNLKIHPWVLKKGITKAIESLRLTKEQKIQLKKIRQNIIS